MILATSCGHDGIVEMDVREARLRQRADRVMESVLHIEDESSVGGCYY